MFEDEESKRMAIAMQDFEKELELETEQEKRKAEKTLNNLVQRKEKLLQVAKVFRITFFVLTFGMYFCWWILRATFFLCYIVNRNF